MVKMKKIEVLFICIHNSARSQMAEAFLNILGKDKFIAKSAGLVPGKLNSYVVEVMKEINIDISKNETKSVFYFYKTKKHFDYVIAVCDVLSKDQCPVFPNAKKVLHWDITDPSTFSSSNEENLKKIRTIRDEIKNHIEDFIKDFKEEN
jgi:arsenate reductase (thioredoxin)